MQWKLQKLEKKYAYRFAEVAVDLATKYVELETFRFSCLETEVI